VELRRGYVLKPHTATIVEVIDKGGKPTANQILISPNMPEKIARQHNVVWRTLSY
jgi:hypothetical protein